jgi:hypothetical protein
VGDPEQPGAEWRGFQLVQGDEGPGEGRFHSSRWLRTHAWASVGVAGCTEGFSGDRYSCFFNRGTWCNYVRAAGFIIDGEAVAAYSRALRVSCRSVGYGTLVQ